MPLQMFGHSTSRLRLQPQGAVVSKIVASSWAAAQRVPSPPSNSAANLLPGIRPAGMRARNSVAVRGGVYVPPAVSVPITPQEQQAVTAMFRGIGPSPTEKDAIDPEYSERVRCVVVDAVNSKSPHTRLLQNCVVDDGGLGCLLATAKQGDCGAVEGLQILCFRNPITVQRLLQEGIIDLICRIMQPPTPPGADAPPEVPQDLLSSTVFLLAALVAFDDTSHPEVMASPLLPVLMALCSTAANGVQAGSVINQRSGTLQGRAAGVLRNLAHNEANKDGLLEAGAHVVLSGVMAAETDIAKRINAAMAVALLVGEEENNALLRVDDTLCEQLLQLLTNAGLGNLQYGTFWTCWKLCQAIAALAGADDNKATFVRLGAVEVLSTILGGRHHKMPRVQQYAGAALWNLAFLEAGREAMLADPQVIPQLRNLVTSSTDTELQEVAKGTLWTLGEKEDLLDAEVLGSPSVEAAVGGGDSGPHVMLSYEWASQQKVLEVKTRLERAGYRIWMDVDKMSGSTLESMALGVEESAAVLCCVTKKYKESQACRTEAEYAFQQRKPIVPLLMEEGYRPTGWLGALLGTKLYFKMTSQDAIADRTGLLTRELGTLGLASGEMAGDMPEGGVEGPGPATPPRPRPADWTVDEVAAWCREVHPAVAEALVERQVNGAALSGLFELSRRTDVTAFIREDLGVPSPVHSLQLLHHLTELFRS